ncbi:ATP-grasp domain-containing protein [Prosthecomicrobium sp. N25]|uniref:ATP-grasp domain-containing protein n=1 Tax=Prosthecomicrobium sp. N25 TaxID=3129254 RepID=UPI003077775F
MADASGSGASVLIAAQSGRALAAAARRAGYVPLVADLFADLDTRALAAAAVAVEGALRTGFRRRSLLAALERLAAGAPSPPIGLVLGSGFEDRPGLIARLAARFRLLGSGAEAVRAAKDPFRLAALAQDFGIPMPRVAAAVPEGGRWLVKRIGGSGGVHVRPARRAGPLAAGHYAAEFAEGEPVSLSFVAGPDGVRSIGFCSQWPDPKPGRPWRFGGIAGPIVLDPALAAEIEAKVERLARALGLLGLASADMLLDDRSWRLLEINPRPGASLPVLDCGDLPLFEAQVRSCNGQSFDLHTNSGPVQGAAVVYADADLAAVREAEWPDWVFDRPEPGSAVAAHDPIATVISTGGTLGEVRARLEERSRAVRRLAGERPLGG